MSSASEKLKLVFTDYFYPGIVIVIFLVIIFLLFRIAYQLKDVERSRRIISALLPPVVLVFAVTWVNSTPDLHWDSLFSAGVGLPLVIGIMVGIAILESVWRFQKAEGQIGRALYILLLSLMGSFILYSSTQIKVGAPYYVLFGFILAAGLYILFRGVPIKPFAPDKLTEVEGTIQELREKFTNLKGELEKSLGSKIEAADSKISEIQTDISQLKKDLDELKQEYE